MDKGNSIDLIIVSICIHIVEKGNSHLRGLGQTIYLYIIVHSFAMFVIQQLSYLSC